MARESTIQILYGTSATTAPVDLSDGEFAYAHGNKKLFIGSNGDNTALWLGAEILDEDTFSSNSDTALATQQSIKSYVDSAIGASAGVVSVSGEAGALDVLVSNGITFAASSGDLIFKGITASTSQIGVASYSSDNFAVSAGGQVTVKNGGIANAELVNSSVSYGGVSLSLGGTDATPAFNLTDATNYPAASLSGTIDTATQLNNNSVSYGGVSVALGSSDATPAFNLADATNYGGTLATSQLTGTITTAQIGNSQVTNAKLANDSVSYGGVSVALGSSDATPAFNLTDATNYPAASLSGTINTATQLNNNSVSYGGVSVALGSSDATPAFNLADATNYGGTLASSQLVGTIATLGGVAIVPSGIDATPAFNLTDATNYPAASLSGTINTATQLNNNTVSYGGVSVALGSSDATPAFNLTDATNYQTSNLSGTISNGQLDNSVLYFTDGISSGSVALGATLGIQGTNNEVTVAFSGGNFTVGLPNDVTIAGNLTVNGTVTTVDTTNLVIEDPLIKLAKNNNSTDSVDIGFYGLYDTSGSQDLYAGLFRDQSDNKFRLFTGLQSEPTTTVNTGGTGYTVGTLVANISGGSF